MKVGINVSWMTPGAAGGMEWYARGVIDQIARIDHDNEYVLLVGPMNYKTFELPGDNWRVYLYEGPETAPASYLTNMPNSSAPPAGTPLYYLRKAYTCTRTLLRSRKTPVWNGKLSDLIAKEGIDVWFCPFMYALPFDTSVPIVNTIPDLQHEYYPELFGDDELRFRTLGYQFSCKKASATIGISSTTARDVVEIYSIDSNKVFAIPISVDPCFDVSTGDLRQCVRDVKTKFNITGDYVYYPANGWPHKNHVRLVEALRYVLSSGCDLRLIFTGMPFGVMDRLKDILTQYDLADHVRHLGYVERKEVIGLYGGAKMLVFPSTFEGFGMPVLEAMTLGIPVVCSKVTSLPEIGGDAAVYFDPTRPKSIAEAIIRVYTDGDLRQRTIRAGKSRAKLFSYRRVAIRTLGVFEKIFRGELQVPALEPPKPPLPWNWLDNGHGRWYFRCSRLKRVTVALIQDTPFTELSGQTVTALLNGEPPVKCVLPPGKRTTISITPTQQPSDGFHRFDLIARLKKQADNQILSARVLGLEIENDEGRVITLIE